MYWYLSLFSDYNLLPSLLVIISQICSIQTFSSLSIPESEGRGKDYSKQHLYLPRHRHLLRDRRMGQYPRWDGENTTSIVGTPGQAWNAWAGSAAGVTDRSCQWNSSEQWDCEMEANTIVWILNEGTTDVQVNKCPDKCSFVTVSCICTFVA